MLVQSLVFGCVFWEGSCRAGNVVNQVTPELSGYRPCRCGLICLCHIGGDLGTVCI